MTSDIAAGRAELFSFMTELQWNNNREWFTAHRDRYDIARAAFEAIVSELLARFGEVDDIGNPTAAACMFRMNRDVRFSRDKSPYKTGMGALFGAQGRKSEGRSYYLHIQPGGQSFLAGGLWDPDGPALAALRRAIARDAASLRAIAAASDFVRHFGALAGESLKTAPAGYPKDHPDIDLLRMKQMVARRPLSDAEVFSDSLTDTILETYAAMKPFVHWIEGAARL